MSTFLSQRTADANHLLTTLEQDTNFRQRFFGHGVDENIIDQAQQYIAETYHCSEVEAEDAIKHLLRKQVQLSERRQSHISFSDPVNLVHQLIDADRNFLSRGGHAGNVWSQIRDTIFQRAGARGFEELVKRSRESAEELLSASRMLVAGRMAQVEQRIQIPPTTDNPIGKTIPVQKTQTPPPPGKKPAVSIDADHPQTSQEKVNDVTKPITENPPNRQQAIIDAIKGLKVSVNELGLKMYGIAMTEAHQGKVVERVIEIVSREMAEQVDDTVRSMASPLLSSGQ